MLPLSGTYSFPVNPCLQADTVALTGEAHVVTVVSSGPAADIYLNLGGVFGTGQSGIDYIGTGANQFSGVSITLNGPANIATASFALQPTNGCAAVALPLTFGLVFGSDGSLLSSSSVNVGNPP